MFKCRRHVEKSGSDFWLDVALREINWYSPPTFGATSDSESSRPFPEWFADGTTNMCYNALDRHVAGGRGDQVAFAFHSTVGGKSRDLTYLDLMRQVEHFAGGLLSLGVEKGDRVIIYMPQIPECAVAMLACARIGCVHSVVFGGRLRAN